MAMIEKSTWYAQEKDSLPRPSWSCEDGGVEAYFFSLPYLEESGFGPVEKSADVFAGNELLLQTRLRYINEWIGKEVARLLPYDSAIVAR
jgi:hypothetical protein